MRLFATLALIAAALFWSHPFLPPEPMKAFLAQIMPGEQSAKPPAFVSTPEQTGSPRKGTVISRAKESSEGPRQ